MSNDSLEGILQKLIHDVKDIIISGPKTDERVKEIFTHQEEALKAIQQFVDEQVRLARINELQRTNKMVGENTVEIGTATKFVNKIKTAIRNYIADRIKQLQEDTNHGE